MIKGLLLILFISLGFATGSLLEQLLKLNAEHVAGMELPFADGGAEAELISIAKANAARGEKWARLYVPGHSTAEVAAIVDALGRKYPGISFSFYRGGDLNAHTYGLHLSMSWDPVKLERYDRSGIAIGYS
jgi:hypothetical protein